MASRRGGPRGPRGRPPANLRRTRVFYDKDTLLNLLQQTCPEFLRYFPPPESFATYQGTNLTDRGDHPMIALLEIGRVWPATGDQNDARRAALCVWDKGGFNSDAPDFVPYSVEGNSERTLVDANGFDATGVFAELRESRRPRQNPVLDDPLVIALIQFIMMLRNNRRYYWYGQRHWESSQEHIGPLVRALHVVTLRWRSQYQGGPRQVMTGAAVPSRQPPPPFALPYQPPTSSPSHEIHSQQPLPTPSSENHSRDTLTTSGMLPPSSPLQRMPPPMHRRPPHIDPRLKAKQLLLATTAEPTNTLSPQDSVVNGDVDNEPKGYVLVTTEATGRTASNRSTTGRPLHHGVDFNEEVLSLLSGGQVQYPV